jgi:hypothetical protein
LIQPGRGGPGERKPPDRHPAQAPHQAVRYRGSVDKKNALRAGAVAAGTTLMMLLMSSPALALTRDDGDDPGPGLSVVETLGLFVVAPIALFAVIAGLTMVLDKSTDRQPKPKPGGKAQGRMQGEDQVQAS